MPIEVGDEEEDAEIGIFSPGDQAPPDTYLEFVARVSEPADHYKQQFQEIKRDLVLANLNKADEENLRDTQRIIRDIFAIEGVMKRYNSNFNLNELKDRWLGRFVLEVEMTRARRAKTLDSLISRKSISEVRTEELNKKEDLWKKFVKF